MNKLSFYFLSLIFFSNVLPAQLTLSISPQGQCFAPGITTTVTVVSAPPGATGYTWTINPALSICTAMNTITVISPTMAVFSFGCCGTRTITCAAYNSGNSLITSTTAVISLPCNNNLTVSSNPDLVCLGGGTTALSASGANTFTWSNGAMGSQTVVSVLNATVFSVTGTFGSGCTITKTVAVNIFAPVFQVTPSSATICPGNSTNFSASGAVTYTWTSGTGPQILFPNIVVSPVANTIYTVAATSVSNSASCASTQTVAVFVTSQPTISATSTPTAACPGETVSLAAFGTSTFTWSTLQQGSVITVTVPGTAGQANYTVVGSSGACNSNTLLVNVLVLPMPVVSVLPNNTSVCAGNILILNASGALTYTWNNNVIAPSITLTAINGANYSVTGTDANGCKNTASYNLTVNASPTITATSSKSLVCKGEKITLTPGGGTSYTWSPAGGSGTLVLTPTVTVHYTLTGSNVSGCTNIASVTVTVDKCQGLPEPEIETGVRLYPNPGLGEIIIETVEPVIVIIQNSSGQIAYMKELYEKVNAINIDALQAGFYLITLKASSFTRKIKFVKQ